MLKIEYTLRLYKNHENEYPEMYQKKTEELVDKFGGFGFGGSMG